jgi:hypothetical protein
MVDNYNRGEVHKKDMETLKKELTRKSDEIRRMVKTPGWKYLRDFLTNSIDINKSRLQELSRKASVDNLNEISDTAITIDVYQSLLDRTDEFIKMGE